MSACGSKRSRITSSGSRKDIGWDHGHDVNGDSKTVKCNYCHDTFTGGIYRFKHHLAGTRENVKCCVSVPEDVKKKILDILIKNFESTKKKKDDIIDLGEDYMEQIEPIFRGKRKNILVGSSNKKVSQTTINGIMKRELREEACQQIARFFYTSAIPFNCVNNPEFARLLDLVGRYGVGLKPPSYHEIREKYLRNEVLRVNDMLEDFRLEWKKTGCSIMSDGWTDKKHRSICNFLVNSPKGSVFLCSIDTSDISKIAVKVLEMLDDIVKIVGEENIVQVVTDNASNYKLAGEITTFIYARSMLIKWMKSHTNERDLIRPAVTRFATSYLTLGCLSELRGGLMSMFTSPEWRSSKYASLQIGKKTQATVLDSRFWKNVNICLKAAYPLIKVLRLVDSDYKPSMGFIYEAMNRAKEKIQINFNCVKRNYEPIWKIVDARWSPQLHRPLHAAGFYLNPHYHYEPNMKWDIGIKTGLYTCICTMVADEEERTKIDLQIDCFKKAQGLFGIPPAIKTRKLKEPADWWDSYGDHCPELQKFAIRVLSLTCSASGCERNWSAFEMVHTKKRNRLHQKKMNDLVFVMYNLKLMERQTKRIEYSFDDIPSDDEWLTEKESHVLPRRTLRNLDRTAENVDDNSNDEESENAVNTSDIRAALEVEEDFVIHDNNDNDEVMENIVCNENDGNVESLDQELAADPNVPDEEYDHDDGGDEDEDFGGDVREIADFY